MANFRDIKSRCLDNFKVVCRCLEVCLLLNVFGWVVVAGCGCWSVGGFGYVGMGVLGWVGVCGCGWVGVSGCACGNRCSCEYAWVLV